MFEPVPCPLIPACPLCAGQLEEGLAHEGYAWLPEPIAEVALIHLEELLHAPQGFARRPLPLARMEAWLHGTPIPDAVRALLGAEARPVRAFWLDKHEEENWDIPWHQDTTFALADALEVPGFLGWHNKAHFYEAQAPGELIARMVSTRLHLDDVGPAEGCLKVLPGSHQHGRLDPAEIADRVATRPSLHVPAHRGSVLLMKPLLLHASDRAISPRRRRILHLEWAAFDLPGGLRWAWF